MTSPYDWIEQSLNTIKKANWYRRTQTINSSPGAIVSLEGRRVINFASNDYLGLAGDPRLKQAAISAIEELGIGSTGSRLLSGQRELHQELEQAIATLKQTPLALVFSSGYLANLGTITAIVGQRDLILADEYNHSSLKNGAKLSGAKIIEYTHCDTTQLEKYLHQYRSQYRRCLIVTDSVFSMDGDLCPLPELLALAEAYNCMLLIDEAHATGVMGKTGGGCVEHFGCTGRELIQVGTLSKAIGSLGGYVAGSASVIDFLRNPAPSWIYTTGLSVADTAAALAAIQIIQLESDRRVQLWKNVELLQHKLSGFNLLPSASPIICLGLKNATEALTMTDKLKQAGIFAPAIRPPTVPTSRLRFSLMATHEEDHILRLAQILREGKRG